MDKQPGDALAGSNCELHHMFGLVCCLKRQRVNPFANQSNTLIHAGTSRASWLRYANESSSY